LERGGLRHEQSHLANGVIACTGIRIGKFAQSNTKGHALELIKQLEKRIDWISP